MKVGVVAIQGDFEKHLLAVRDCGVEAVEVRTPEDLAGVNRVIIPGGESTTVGKLMERFGLGPALIIAGRAGLPIWGTCMGMIILARAIKDREQYSLGLLDIEVTRNAFGAQVHSFEDEVTIAGLDAPVMGVFIRAPIVSQLGDGVSVIAEYDGKIVGVRQRNVIGTSFHPELNDDRSLHRFFLEI
jgi:pyridoxal 5'-phosphate synthase pdxT subunit